MALDRTWYNSLVNDDGSGTKGTIWRKEDVGTLMDTVDQEIARLDSMYGSVVVQRVVGISGVINDLELIPNVQLLLLYNTNPLTLTGMKAGIPGQLLFVTAVNSAPVYLAYRDNRSLPTNQLVNTVFTGVTPLAPYFGRALYVYDGDEAFWRLVNHVQGQALPIPWDATNFSTDQGGVPWNTTQASVGDLSYTVNGKTLAISTWLNNAGGSSLGGTTAKALRMKTPNNYQLGRTQLSPSILWCDASGVPTKVAIGWATLGNTYIEFVLDMARTLTWPTGVVGLIGTQFLEIV